MAPHLLAFTCETVAEEMKARQSQSILQGIDVVTPAFIEAWNLDEEIDMSPFLSQTLQTAAQTEHAKLHNKKKKLEKMCQVSSNHCLAFQAEFGLFLWSTGCARQTINALFKCGLSVCYDSVLNLIELLSVHCMVDAIEMVKKPHGFCYNNMQLNTSIFVEQRGAMGPAKVTSGTFGILYLLWNAAWEHMLFNQELHSYHDQLIVVVIQCLTNVRKSRRAIPVGYTMLHCPLNLLFHDETYINQLRRTPESLSKYIIPGFHDQLTNSCIRSGQLLRAKDVNAWTCCDIFQLGFGLFHLCLNLVWVILHIHRGSVNEARLGNDQPDYHSLLAALTHVLDGLLLNAWLKECGFTSFKLFAQSKPSPDKL
ncbi:hypothetical protein B0H11DRAFT_2154382 [Mycena galericulata]|nr:hypothetical protein B0H11DRAFT_2154382 [Mycena galericulata]